MTASLTIARLTLHEARRRRIVLAALALGAVFLLVYGLGLYFIVEQVAGSGVGEAQRRFGYGILVLVGFYGIHFLTVMLAIFSSAGTVSGEISSHTVQSLVTKPLQRWEVLLGKWLGHGAMLGSYVALLGGGMLLLVLLLAGFLPANAVHAMALLVLEALVLLSLSLLGGTRVSTPANGVFLFLLYGLAFTGAWVGQIGTLLQAPAATRVGTVVSLILPVEALWRRAAHLLTPPLPLPIPVTPFTGGAVPGAEIVLYAIFYSAAVLGLAALSFQRRDL